MRTEPAALRVPILRPAVAGQPTAAHVLKSVPRPFVPLAFGAVLYGLVAMVGGQTYATNMWMVWLLGLFAYYVVTNDETAMCVLAFAMPFEFIFHAWGFGRYNMLSYAAIALAIYRFSSSRVRKPLNLAEWACVCLLIWSGFSLSWAQDLWQGVEILFTEAGLFSCLYVFRRGQTSPASVRTCLWYFIAGTVLLIGVMMLYYQRSTFRMHYTWVVVSALGADEVSGYEVAGASIVCFLAALMLWELEKRNAARIPLMACAFVLGMATFLALSRSLILAWVTTSLVWAVMSPGIQRVKRIALVLGLVGAAAFVGFSLNPGAATIRFEVASNQVLASDARGITAGRNLFWDYGFQSFSENVLMGIGVGQFGQGFSKATGDPVNRGAHNVMLQMLVELGVPGVCLFALLCAALFVNAWRAGPWRHVALAWWVFFIFDSQAHGWNRNKSYWVVAGLTACLADYYNKKPVPAIFRRQQRLAAAGENGYPPDPIRLRPRITGRHA